MSTVSEIYANSSKYCMDDTDFFSTVTITMPIGFRLVAVLQLSLSLTIGKIFGLVGLELKGQVS